MKTSWFALHCIFLTLLPQLIYAQDSIINTNTYTDLDHKINSVFKQAVAIKKIDFSIDKKESSKKYLTDNFWKEIKNSNGYITTAYSYGLNTVYIDSNRSIGSIFNTNGVFNTVLFKIPLNISFNYSSLKIPLGTTNFFRASFDQSKFDKIKSDQINESVDILDEKLKNYKKSNAEILSYMGLIEVNIQKIKSIAEREAKILYEKKKNAIIDSLNQKQDSLIIKSELNGDKTNLHQIDSLENRIKKLNGYQDSLHKIYNTIVSTKNKLDTTIQVATQMLETLKCKTDITSKNINYNQLNWWEKIRKIDLGLSYPKTTGLSNQNVPIKGINLEFQFKKIYLAVASGLTLNNWMFSVNEIQNQLNYNQNVFNYFDFQRIKNNGWRNTLKFGYGNPDNNHALIGINYLTNLNFNNSISSLNPSASVEVDLGYSPTFSPKTKFEITYGKTSKENSIDSINRSITSTIFSSYASNLFYAGVIQKIDKIKTEFSLKFRRVDPFANTSAIGVLQPNHQRFEIKSTHRLHRLFKVNLQYKNEQSLKQLSDQNQVQLDILGAEISGYKLNFINYSLYINYVEHGIYNSNSIKRGNNYLMGGSATGNYGNEDLKVSSSLISNNFLINDSISFNKYTQTSFTQSFQYENWQAGIVYEYFFKRNENIKSNTYVTGVFFKYRNKRTYWNLSTKYANVNKESTFGGHLEFEVIINKWMELGAKVEKFIAGDFYRSYYKDQFDRFPYLFTIQTKFKL